MTPTAEEVREALRSDESTPVDTSGVVTRHRSSGFRLQLLIIGFCACAWVFLAVAKTDRQLRNWLQSLAPKTHVGVNADLVRIMTERDPVLGSHTELPLVDATWTTKPRLWLVIMMGSCSSCSLSHMNGADEIEGAVSGLKTVAVVDSTASTVAEFRSAHHLRMTMVTDQRHRLSNLYNAAWTPRAYLISPEGKLEWIQTNWQFNAEEITRAAREFLETKP